MSIYEYNEEEVRKVIREDAWEDGRAEGLADGKAEGRAEEKMNTDRERKRAEDAEAEVRRLREELQKRDGK